MGKVEVLGRQITYVTEGQGPPLILLPGLGSSWEKWGRSLKELSKYFTVFVVDLPGHGRSGPLQAEETSFSFGVAFLRVLCDELGLDRPIVAGFSFGGLLALRYTLSHPDRVEKLILVGSAGLGRHISWFMRCITLPVLGELVTVPSMLKILMLTRDRSTFSEETIADFCKARRLPGDQKVFLRMLRYGISFLGGQKATIRVSDGLLESLEVPTLIIYGDEDRFFPLAPGMRAARILSNGEFHRFSGTGHRPQIEHPKEFAEVVRDFCLKGSACPRS